MGDHGLPEYYVEGVQHHRHRLSRQHRSLIVQHTIDPGFVNHRLVHTVLGDGGTTVINDLIAKLPEMPDWQRRVQVDQIYKDVALKFCEINGIRTLGELIHDQNGHMFCSTDPWGPSPGIYEGVDRLVSRWVPYSDVDTDVELHYSAKHVVSDTLRSQLNKGAELSVIGHFHRRERRTVVFHPLVIGNPWLHTEDPAWVERVVWWGHNFYEHFVEDFAEFSKVDSVAEPADPSPMQVVSERAFKRALRTILGDVAALDWGGETSDYVSAHLHLDGRRVMGAFLLKGPANFVPMTLRHLGKNNDQIYRLAMEPADVLFVQHCHDVTPPVRATLRAFAVQPSRPRRYCVIDGRDSLRLLLAYGLYEQAVQWSREG
jgi:hypothetical protein